MENKQCVVGDGKLTFMDLSKSIIKPQKPVGYYSITGRSKNQGNIYFEFVKKPNFINRFFCKILLGWFWHDYN